MRLQNKGEVAGVITNLKFLVLTVKMVKISVIAKLKAGYRFLDHSVCMHNSRLQNTPYTPTPVTLTTDVHVVYKYKRTLAIMTFAAFQLRSFGTFCVLFAIRTMTAAATLTTAGGG